jgi:hypothetical protein
MIYEEFGRNGLKDDIGCEFALIYWWVFYGMAKNENIK